MYIKSCNLSFFRTKYLQFVKNDLYSRFELVRAVFIPSQYLPIKYRCFIFRINILKHKRLFITIQK